MAAYNDCNGVAATEQDHVINEVVKGEWGWDGLVVSDWFATKTAGPAANGGLDLVIPGPNRPRGPARHGAGRRGEVAAGVAGGTLRGLGPPSEPGRVPGPGRTHPERAPAPP